MNLTEKLHQTSLQLPAGLRRDLRIQAAKNDRSLSKEMVHHLKKAMKAELADA